MGNCIAAAVLGYGALSIGMTLLFKRALSLFAYPCILVAATFVFEAAAVRAASGPASGLDDGNGRPLFLIACCVGGEVALSNSGLMLLSVAAHTMIKACTPVFVLCAAMFLKLEAASHLPRICASRRSRSRSQTSCDTPPSRN